MKPGNVRDRSVLVRLCAEHGRLWSHAISTFRLNAAVVVGVAISRVRGTVARRPDVRLIDGAALASVALLAILMARGPTPPPEPARQIAMARTGTGASVSASHKEGPEARHVPQHRPEPPEPIQPPRAKPAEPLPLSTRVATGAPRRPFEVVVPHGLSFPTGAPVLGDARLGAPSVPSKHQPDQCTPADGHSLVSSRQQRARRVIAPSIYRTLDEHGVRAALVSAARAQMTGLAVYHAAYTAIAYPAGDVPSFYGVCTDVVIRAYRTIGIDLQTLVQVTAIGSGDRSIDHRRTDVLRRFFERHAQVMPRAVESMPNATSDLSAEGQQFRPGDIVTYYRPQNRSSTSHMALVSDRIGPSGQPMIIHNRGWGVQEEDALFVDKMTGHYRLLALNPALAHRMEAVLQGAGLRPASDSIPDPVITAPAAMPGLASASTVESAVKRVAAKRLAPNRKPSIAPPVVGPFPTGRRAGPEVSVSASRKL